MISISFYVKELKFFWEVIRFNGKRIRKFVNKQNCKIEFKHNVPDASNMECAWAGMIRSIR